MAYLVKPQRSSFLSAVWRDASGKQIRRSTKVKDRKTAKKIAEAYEAASLKQRTAKQVRKVIATLHREITGDELAFPTIKDYLATWIARKKPETSRGTIEVYRRVVTVFLEHLGEASALSTDLISVQHIAAFRNARAILVSAKSTNRDLKVVRMIFRAARKEGFVIEDPTEHVDAVRTKGGAAETRRAFTLPELRVIMSVADPEWRSMILFGLYAGMRIGDAAKLTWANLDLTREELRYTASKTDRAIILPLSGPLAVHVATLEAGYDPRAPLHPKSFALIERTGRAVGISNGFAQLLIHAGLRERKTQKVSGAGRGSARAKSIISFHSLRHTAVSLLKDAGVPAAVVMELVGHDSEQMSQHYTHVGREALISAADKMPRL